MVHILAGEQDLGHGVVILEEQPVVGVHQLALAHGGGGLLGGHVGGLAGQVQLAHAHADGAGGDQNHLMAGVFQVGEHLDQLLHVADVQPPGGVGQGGGAHLYNDSHGINPLYQGIGILFGQGQGFFKGGDHRIHGGGPEARSSSTAPLDGGAAGGADPVLQLAGVQALSIISLAVPATIWAA